MLLQCTKMALRAIIGNKMRSFLTMLGIIVGVLALVVLVSLVNSAADSVTESVNELGTDLLRITIRDDGGEPLRLGEVDTFAAHEAIGAVAPVSQVTTTARYRYESRLATAFGTTPAYLDIAGLTLRGGRFLRQTDLENASLVAVICETAAEDLFGTRHVLGANLSLDGKPFTVVGVLAQSEDLTSLFAAGHAVYIPYTTAIRLPGSAGSAVNSLQVNAADGDMDLAEAAMEYMLLRRFSGNADAFSIFNQSILSDAMDEITGVLTYLLGGIAAISLIVGGIGIMNIMLVSVTERTKEIGVRKAIGAGRWSIMLQFLIEALVICLIGCLIGVAVSWALLQAASALVGDLLDFRLAGGVVLAAVVFSLFIGLVFGLYPANQAAKKRPIEALRYEG